MISVREILFPIGPSIAYIPLTQNLFALIEVEDVPKVRGINWHVAWFPDSNGYYASCFNPTTKRQLLLHRILMGSPKGIRIDHRNRNGLDCRKQANLRRASHSQNRCNSIARKNSSTGLKGISFDKSRNNYQAEVRFEGKRIRLGRFSTAEAAYAAYCAKAKELHGEFARLA